MPMWFHRIVLTILFVSVMTLIGFGLSWVQKVWAWWVPLLLIPIMMPIYWRMDRREQQRADREASSE